MWHYICSSCRCCFHILLIKYHLKWINQRLNTVSFNSRTWHAFYGVYNDKITIMIWVVWDCCDPVLRSSFASPWMCKTRRQKYQHFWMLQATLPSWEGPFLSIPASIFLIRKPKPGSQIIKSQERYRVFEQSNVLFIPPPPVLGKSDIRRQIV